MPSDRAIQFVKDIVDLTENTGDRAALRSGLGRTVDRSDRMHKYLARWTDSSRPHREAVHYTIAALIAHNPSGAIPTTPPGSIGASLARCTKLAVTTREKSVHLLARQSAGQLCRMLTRIIVPLRTTENLVNVDFALLLDDASGWPWQHQRTGRRWLQDYYRVASDTTDRAS